jgi:hypothetical protein
MSKKSHKCKTVLFQANDQKTPEEDIAEQDKKVLHRRSKLLPLPSEDSCSVTDYEIIRDEDETKEYYDYKPKTEEQYRRYKNFIELNPVCKRIILRMYKSFRDYIETQDIHPLEETVFLLYKFWDSESTIRAIASRVGIYIPFIDNYTASEILLDKLISILEKNPSGQKISEIINMTETQFEKLFYSRSFKTLLKTSQVDFEVAYQNRLIFILDA